MYSPKGTASKIYQAFCEILKTSKYTSEIEAWFDGTEGDENDSYSQSQITATIAPEASGSGWAGEDIHSFEMSIGVSVYLPGRQGLAAMDLGESVVRAIFPNDDTESREIARRLMGSTLPVGLTISRWPASFEYDDDSRVTSSTTIFALTVHHQTIGEY